MMRGMQGMHGYGSTWMLVFWIAFWVILIVFGIFLLNKFINGDNKKVKRNDNLNNNKNTPLEILQERLARGEIDEGEYERLKSIIERDRG